MTLCRVDGLLFVNMNEVEQKEFGVHNRFHLRKLNLILKSYQTRYNKKKMDLYAAEDDDLSEYTPSGSLVLEITIYV